MQQEVRQEAPGAAIPQPAGTPPAWAAPKQDEKQENVASIEERRRISIDGAGLSASEYLIRATTDQRLDERAFLVSPLGANIFAVTLDRNDLKAGDTARLVVVRRGAVQ